MLERVKKTAHSPADMRLLTVAAIIMLLAGASVLANLNPTGASAAPTVPPPPSIPPSSYYVANPCENLPQLDLVDTDFDHYSDCLELRLGTNPLRLDSDADTIADGIDLLPLGGVDPVLAVTGVRIREISSDCDVPNENQYFDPYLGVAYASLVDTSAGTHTGFFGDTNLNSKQHGHDAREVALTSMATNLVGPQQRSFWGTSNAFGLPGVSITLSFLDHDSTNSDDNIDIGTVPVLPAYKGIDGTSIVTASLGASNSCSGCVALQIDSPIKFDDALATSLPLASPAPGVAPMVTMKDFMKASSKVHGDSVNTEGECAVQTANTATDVHTPAPNVHTLPTQVCGEAKGIVRHQSIDGPAYTLGVSGGSGLAATSAYSTRVTAIQNNVVVMSKQVFFDATPGKINKNQYPFAPILLCLGDVTQPWTITVELQDANGVTQWVKTITGATLAPGDAYAFEVSDSPVAGVPTLYSTFGVGSPLA